MVLLGSFIVFAIILCGCLAYYRYYYSYKLTCIVSNGNGNTYCVRERKRIHQSVNLLVRVTQKCVRMVNYLKHSYPNNNDVNRLYDNFNPNALSETLPTSTLTAYTENKGKQIAFCLQKSKNTPALIDLHTLTFVAFHELAHVMTLSKGHKQEFWDNFKFILVNAKQAGIYNSTDYEKYPGNFCGTPIHSNPYYNM